MLEEITQARLKYLYEYDANTGLFKRTENVIRRSPKVYAGTKGRFYLSEKIDGKNYKMHRLAWLYVYGEMPKNIIDHIDGDPFNNRIENLRDVSDMVNQQNRRRANKNGSSGYLGVSWASSRNKWCAAICLKGKNMHLGYFDDPKVAHEVYLNRKREIHEGCVI